MPVSRPGVFNVDVLNIPEDANTFLYSTRLNNCPRLLRNTVDGNLKINAYYSD